jgi:hypothetical protein
LSGNLTRLRRDISGREVFMNKRFPVNEHPAERVVRILVGVALVTLAVGGKIGAWGWIGVLPILTGLTGSCLLYTAFGFSTCGKSPAA